MLEDRGHEAGFEAIELEAGVAQAGHFDDSFGAEPKARPCGEGEEVEAAGGDVLAHFAVRHAETAHAELLVQLRMDEVDLAEVGLRGVARDARAVLHLLARVSVAFDAKPGQEGDAFDRGLTHRVAGTAVDSFDARALNHQLAKRTTGLVRPQRSSRR